MTLRERFFSFLITLFIFLFALSVPALAQEPAGREKPKDQAALEEKALSLLDEVIAEAQALKLPENRIRIQFTAADMLWERDQMRARALFAEAASSLGEIMRGIESSDPQYYNLIQIPSQLRQEMLMVVARRDARLARDFLRATRQPPPPRVDQNYRDPELGLELSLATQLAASDPRQALEIGEEVLSRGEFSSWLVNLLAQLQAKDKNAAAKLAAEMIKRLRAENLMANQEAKNVALNLLSMGPRPSETGDPSGMPISGRWGGAGQVLDESAFRELLELVIASALNSAKGPLEQREYDGARNLLMGLQSLLPQIDKYLPARAPAVRRKLAEMEKTMDAQARAWNSYNNLVQQGSVEAILDAAPKAPADVRSNLYWQAAQKALNEGNAARARQIANEQFEPAQRSAFFQDLDRQLMWRQASEGKIEEARQLVARLRSVEERVQALVQLSATASQKDLKKLALQLLDEARSLVSRRAENYSQLDAQLQVARAYSALEPTRSFELLEPVIEQINAFIPAAALLNGFETHYFKEGELPLQGGSMLGSMIQRLAQELAALARVDFERTQALAERFERPEPRIAARLAIAQGVLARNDAASGAVVGVGFGVSYGRGSWRQ